ncbi:hypothetical protein GGR56DRAFT_637286 [Xylariaceae sp. FL0804]|nr:hypothetical protein GGR56DRAFT_637286 [Xylariaceae sp. FL0804]
MPPIRAGPSMARPMGSGRGGGGMAIEQLLQPARHVSAQERHTSYGTGLLHATVAVSRSSSPSFAFFALFPLRPWLARLRFETESISRVKQLQPTSPHRSARYSRSVSLCLSLSPRLSLLFSLPSCPSASTPLTLVSLASLCALTGSPSAPAPQTERVKGLCKNQDVYRGTGSAARVGCDGLSLSLSPSFFSPSLSSLAVLFFFFVSMQARLITILGPVQSHGCMVWRRSARQPHGRSAACIPVGFASSPATR